MATREDMKREFLRLLKEDEAFREEVLSIITEVVPRREELADLTKEIRLLTEKISTFIDETRRNTETLQKTTERLIERVDALEEALALMAKRMDSFEEEMRKFREEATRRMDSFEEALALMAKRMDSFEEEMRKVGEILGGLGARWGFASEEAFREGLRGLMEGYGLKVSKWEYYDSECVVFKRPSMIEVDVLVRDKEHVLVEIKSSISKEDVDKLLDKARLYEMVEKVKPSLAIVSPFVHPKAEEYAKMNNVKVYTSVREVSSKT
ncbi:MAG: DUF3782 domain-containing protein [Candidatus Jordarchaeales archaeon]